MSETKNVKAEDLPIEGVKDLPTPGKQKISEEDLQKKFQEMYMEFTEQARKETGYVLVPQIGPNGPFNTTTKVPDETA